MVYLKNKLHVIIISLIIIAVIGSLLFYAFTKKENSIKPIYEIATIEYIDPLIFSGIVQAENIKEIFINESLGNVCSISITDGQEISEGTLLFTYQNDTVKDQADGEEQSLSKLVLAVDIAQQNLSLAIEKQDSLNSELTEAINKYNNQKTDTPEDEAKKSELKSIVDQLEDSIETQKGVIIQNQQNLDSANLELSNANTTVAKTKEKITTTVTSDMSGIAYINMKGKTDPSQPFITLVSPQTVIDATVSEYDYHRLFKEQKVIVKPITSNEQISGNIKLIEKLPKNNFESSNATSSNQISNYNFIIKPDKQLQFGLSVDVLVNIEEIRISKTAVIESEKEKFVFLYKDSKAVKTSISLKEENGVYIVLDGVSVGDNIITNPDEHIKDGLVVEVKK
ncbi:hypothetical protein IW492_08630 [Enterococcus sp. BWB1-3]|uniref:efflux RND transporter periplasmic adaptor subunit n=1 Tax=Enterococcus sp. BWB1-3 TaxID=2787713 RepID=UPI001924FCFA|nr:hypothetical protein [Enterococcus sp. BWB1-3]MBL1229294.1 hypothetical protein [Enterococcus sp. BWB1-3]